MNDFVSITSTNRWFEKHPEKIAGVEFESSSIYFPIQVKGTKEDVLRVTGMLGETQPNEDKTKRIRIVKAKAAALKLKLSLLNS